MTVQLIPFLSLDTDSVAVVHHPRAKSGSLVPQGYRQAHDIHFRLVHPCSDRLSCLSPLSFTSGLFQEPPFVRTSECSETVSQAGPRPNWLPGTQASALADPDSASNSHSGKDACILEEVKLFISTSQSLEGEKKTVTRVDVNSVLIFKLQNMEVDIQRRQ